ncbi:MAG: hypothetical protein CM15mP22_0380 [Gammaproteobacteria bacterium]|nr:MAG: hypothetical protein CM15mP22_0380 [Gammaproteobacteria bacterium]
MKKISIFVLIFISCDSNDWVILLINMNQTAYIFTLTEVMPIHQTIVSWGGGQAEVTKEVYDSFNLGEEYCID